MPSKRNCAFGTSAGVVAFLTALVGFSARVVALEEAGLSDTYGKLQLHFEKNQGQTHDDVRFLSRGAGHGLYLTAEEAVLVLAPAHSEPRRHGRGTRGRLEAQTRAKAAVVRMSLRGAAPHPRMRGLGELPGKVNYLIGPDPTAWRTNVPTYGRVHYAGIYPGIDLVFYGNQRHLEYDFVVAPGADPRQIVLQFGGAEKLEIDEQGDLVLTAAGRAIRQRKPLIYQEANDQRDYIAGNYVLKGRNRVAFEVAAYDVSRPLVIDPVLLIYATYLGGSGFDSGNRGMGIAVDSRGNAYVTGSTQSNDFPTTGTFQPVPGGGLEEVFVSKLNAVGSALVYSTYLGGNGTDLGGSIAVDVAGNAYVTGTTSSSNFPATAGALQSALAGKTDAFVAKLDPTGSALIYSTHLGGSAFEFGGEIALDEWSNAYVTGSTGSLDFPTTPGVTQPSLGPGMCFDRMNNIGSIPCDDAFVAKLNPAGAALVYSTYLGGSNEDVGSGIAVDAAGSAYVTGRTLSANFPTTPGAFQPAASWRGDAFVAKLDVSGASLVYATYLGSVGADRGEAIAVDFNGSAYVVGTTTSVGPPPSNSFPTTPGALRTEFADEHNTGCSPAFPLCSSDAFVTQFDVTGSALVYSTYLGGTQSEGATAIAVDEAGNAYVTGSTTSTNFPTTPDAFQSTPAGAVDAFVTKLNPAGSGLVYSTYLGGGDSTDVGYGISVNTRGVGADDVFVVGDTTSTDFPTTPVAVQPAHAGGFKDAFVARILGAGLPPRPVTAPTSPARPPVAAAAPR